MAEAKYPNATAQLSGKDGNAMVIISTVRRALRHSGAPAAEVDEFTRQAMDGNYDNVLRTAMEWVNVQ
jgi:hypothetical protein